MSRLLTLVVVAAFLYPLAAGAVTPSKTTTYTNSGVSLSLLDPIGSVYREGEEVGFSVRTQEDAYVIVFDIDTEGFVHLLYPTEGKNFQKFYSGRVYQIPEDPGASLVVGGPRGLEFVFAVAVENRDAINEDEVHFLARNESLPMDRRFRITGDPFLGANRIMSQLVRGTSLRRDVTISFTYFYVGEAVDYPRYLCEDCYEKGKDPYGGGMPAYVASADFEKTDGLTYPLAEGFVGEYASTDAPGLTETQSNVTKVYVSYYPRWDTGFYSTTWWYLDPWYAWYWDPWYAPYSGFYFSVGWNWGWGWGACHYRYFPYYYCGPYYAYRPGWGYYSCYPDYYGYGCGSWYGPSRGTNHWRSFGVVPKGSSPRRSTLHTAMNQRVSREFGLAQRSVKASGVSDRRAVAEKRYGTERNIRSLEPRRPQQRNDVRIIRGTTPKGQRDNRTVIGRDSRQAGPVKGYREQRVITRSTRSERSVTRGRVGGVDTRRLEGGASKVGRRIGQPKAPRTQVAPNTSPRKSEARGTYKPNVRRNTGGKSAPPRMTGGSSGRSSSSSSRATSSSRSGASKGGARQKR